MSTIVLALVAIVVAIFIAIGLMIWFGSISAAREMWERRGKHSQETEEEQLQLLNARRAAYGFPALQMSDLSYTKGVRKMIELGDRVADRMTLLEGIVVAKTQWLYGCNRITVQPTQLKDGRPQELLSFDEPQLEVIKAGAFPAETLNGVGGPRQEPTRRDVPKK